MLFFSLIQNGYVQWYEEYMEEEIDTTTLRAAFVALLSDANFMEELTNGDNQARVFTEYSEIISGDLNEDGAIDALISFSVQGFGGGVNAIFYYAVFFFENGNWEYQTKMEVGTDKSEYYLEFVKIIDGAAMGVAHPRDAGTAYQFSYRWINGNMLCTHQSIHQAATESKPPSLILVSLFDEQMNEMPFFAQVEELEQLWGKGSVILLNDNEKRKSILGFEQAAKFLEYPFITYEIGEDQDVALVEIRMKGSGYRLFTSIGTLYEDTEMNEVLFAFMNNVQQIKLPDQTCLVFSLNYSDDKLVLFFDAQKQLSLIRLYPDF